ncbi:DUF29 domain-containing protein [Larkinella terrae]|uniref:DUF29 family protein n=1 Tax=Larkinella terrae TaxID=2025311 RepID=A0A7K0EGI8_9BACT|nr:DUF29 domain-containing protein [Larkinella terrae]MRS60558.1 DUF29 family protein [Larkinella terrae]
MKPDWQDLVSSSYPETVVTIRKMIEQSEYEEAMAGLDELEESMSKHEQRAVKSQLTRLMAHILKWRYQPDKRSTSWALTIANSRIEIEDSQETMPSLNTAFIQSIWEKCFDHAITLAKAEMNLSRKDKFEPAPLTWQEVFEDEYLL